MLDKQRMNVKSGWQRRRKEPKTAPSSRAETLPMIEEKVRLLRVIAFTLRFFSPFCGCRVFIGRFLCTRMQSVLVGQARLDPFPAT